MKGKRIGEYHITNQLLGQGSFSQVYLGYSDQSQKVAVKIIPRDNIEGTYCVKYRKLNLSVLTRDKVAKPM